MNADEMKVLANEVTDAVRSCGLIVEVQSGEPGLQDRESTYWVIHNAIERYFGERDGR